MPPPGDIPAPSGEVEAVDAVPDPTAPRTPPPISFFFNFPSEYLENKISNKKSMICIPPSPFFPISFTVSFAHSPQSISKILLPSLPLGEFHGSKGMAGKREWLKGEGKGRVDEENREKRGNVKTEKGDIYL